MPAFHVERSTIINTSPEKVFEVVADYQTWPTWSPWLIAEPEAAVKISDDSNSVGSSYSWEGDVTGAGELEHLELEPGKHIRDEIRFFRPMKTKSIVEFDFEPTDDGTRVTWSMDGKLPWFMFFLRSMMDGFIGMDYERGLRMLKEWIETGDLQSKLTFRGTIKVGPIKMIGVRKSCTFDNIGPSMSEAFANAEKKFADNNIPIDGKGISVYHKMNMKAKTFEYTSGFIVPESTTTPAGAEEWAIPEMNAYVVEHLGRYEHLGNAWSAANQHVRYKKMKQARCGAFEIYENNPDNTEPADLRTDIFLPLKG